MSKRRRLLILLACLSGLGLVAVLLTVPREPRDHHQPLSHWVLMLGSPRANAPESPEASAAVTAIGTNALPFLLDWVQYESAPGRAKLSMLIARLRHTPPPWPGPRSRREHLAWGADRALCILGTQAVSALPELVRLMNDSSRPETARRAAGSLRALGTNSLPALLAVVDNPNHPCRTSAILALEIMGRDIGPGMAPALPYLVQCLDPTNGVGVPGWAARALGEFGFASQTVVPALADCLKRRDKYLRITCAKALAGIGEPASSALPALTNALADPDPEVSTAASNAIFIIAKPFPR